MNKSPDAFRTISEVADWLNTPAHVLRFWESRFSQIKPVKRAGGRRYYRPADMTLLGGIKKLLHEDGMTIRGVQKLLRENGVKYVAALSAPVDGVPVEEPTVSPSESPTIPQPPKEPVLEVVSKDDLPEDVPAAPMAEDVPTGAFETKKPAEVVQFNRPDPALYDGVKPRSAADNRSDDRITQKSDAPDVPTETVAPPSEQPMFDFGSSRSTAAAEPADDIEVADETIDAADATELETVDVAPETVAAEPQIATAEPTIVTSELPAESITADVAPEPEDSDLPALDSAEVSSIELMATDDSEDADAEPELKIEIEGMSLSDPDDSAQGLDVLSGVLGHLPTLRSSNPQALQQILDRCDALRARI